MLYEMVTGRPPFVGDESVAIIGQHLNTPPVAPTWHNPTVPPGLEALILRLLEKDPAKRPKRAEEVREALAHIAPSQRATRDEAATKSPTVTDANENPLYRRVFVGREQELRQLQSAFDGALSGKGALAMVVGEPGIGKTSVCEQLSTYAAIRGGKTLVGHCYEEGSLSLAYLPFIEAMRSYVLTREPEGLRSDLGSGAGEVARIVSEVRDRIQVTPWHTGDAEEQRWRLLQAVSGFLRSASTVQPLLIILEDLHDADRGTLDLLVHLSRNLDGARLLVVGTYRDVEVDRSHPLSSVLAELRRGQNFLRVPLRGLTAEEVQRMMAAVARREIPWPLAELVHRQTEGNPLFVQEVLRYLVEEGLVSERDGSLRRVGDDALAGRIPEGLRDVIGKRLSRLADKTNEVLSIASVIGREFRLDVLQAVANLPQEDVEEALEEAANVAVVEQRTGIGGQLSFRFAHAFFRQTLYEELFAARRIRLHQQVARALEAVYGRRLEEHAAELAEHYSNSSDPQDLSRAVAYGEMAANRAMTVFAYGEAVGHLEQALKAQEVLDPDDKAKRCDLLIALAEAVLLASEPLRAVNALAPAALELATVLGDQRRASRACRVALEGIVRMGGGSGLTTEQAEYWTKQSDLYANSGSSDRAIADLALGNIAYFGNRPGEAWDLCQRALASAQRLDDREIVSRCVAQIAALGWLPKHQAVRLQIVEEYGLASLTEDAPSVGTVLHATALRTFLSWGRRAEVETQVRRAREMAQRRRDRVWLLTCGEIETLLLGIDGEFTAALEAGVRLRDEGEEQGVAGLGASVAFHATLWPLLHMGRFEEAWAAQPEVARRAALQGRSTNYTATMALCLAHLERREEANALLDGLRSRWDPERQTYEQDMTASIHSLATAVQLRDRELAVRLAADLAIAADLLGVIYPTAVARHLGGAYALAGEREKARRYYNQSRAVCEKVHFRPELALTRLGIAELLLEDADKAQRTEALGHLDFAIGEFREMKMQPSLERALRHKEVLKA